MDPVVSREEVAALSRHLSDAYGVALRMRTRLEEHATGPVALLAALRVSTVEAVLESLLENQPQLGEILEAVGKE